MNWQEVCNDPNLQNLPYKIELNQWGQIVMSPVKVLHSIYQGRIIRKISGLMKNGEVVPECAIQTSKGTKAADVAWISDDRLKIVQDETQCSVAPDICVEVMSESNTEDEMQKKKKLYFEAGAKEVWICDNGQMLFYTTERKSEFSLMMPGFPQNIEI
ncbi:Uma2 family endonuclease [Desulfobacterales bacterium HSG17]|nr:Uma2 family endonuclease [Desulfobacterales bacterium HSG17]